MLTIQSHPTLRYCIALKHHIFRNYSTKSQIKRTNLFVKKNTQKFYNLQICAKTVQMHSLVNVGIQKVTTASCILRKINISLSPNVHIIYHCIRIILIYLVTTEI